MKLSQLFKFAAVGGVCLLLLVPLVQIHGLVRERQAARDAAVADIARGSGLAQRVVGPLLVVPVFDRLERRSTLVLLPERLDATVKLDTDLRRRGIYTARVFHSNSHLSGHFVLPPIVATSDDRSTPVRYGPPVLAMGIEDIRGIGADLALNVGETRLAFESGSTLPQLGKGVHATLAAALDGATPQQIAFAIDLPLQGTDSFSIAPTGRETRVRMQSDWPHPSFIGELLPTARNVGATGFDASWQTSFFATNMRELLDRCLESQDCKAFVPPSVGVTIVDPVDQYVRTDRAIKYALLFIALTFAGFLLLEVLRKVDVHPIQYGLVGLALALFFLLLLSLSEHVGFALAYVLAAAACIGLLGYYLAHVLRSVRLGAGFAAAFALLYSLLYGILGAEDYALLMGSLLLFAMLATFMVLTRRIDWSQFGAAPRPEL